MHFATIFSAMAAERHKNLAGFDKEVYVFSLITLVIWVVST